jgi:23S rRNA (pseudouridine1915-N3)-methyltransferase
LPSKIAIEVISFVPTDFVPTNFVPANEYPDKITNITNFLKMFIKILAIGKINSTPYGEIFDMYQKRIRWKVNIKELELKGFNKNTSANDIIEKEEKLFSDNIPQDHKLICLDKSGKNYSTEEFSNFLQKFQTSSEKICFLIGGAHGFSQNIKLKSDNLVSFGKMTFPHMLARTILIEQIYRSFSIANNHPYHK